MHLVLASATRQILDCACDGVVLPAAKGEIEILPGHTALLTLLTTGVMKVRRGSACDLFVLHDGFAQINGNEIRVIAETVEKAAEIDRASNQQKLEQLHQQLRAGGLDPAAITACYDEIRLIRSRLSAATNS